MTRPSPHKDPRRALGVRAGPTPILPRLNVEDHDEPTIAVSRPYLPTPPASYTSENDAFHTPDTVPFAHFKAPADRGAIETRKLLSHVLTKLEQRDSCPDLLELAIKAGQSSNIRDKGKAKAVMNHVMAMTSQDVDEQDEEQLDQGWNNEATCDLVEQLRSLLVLAQRQGVQLFDSNVDVSALDDKPQRKSKVGRFSSLASPTTKRQSQERQSVVRQTLLERTLTIVEAMLLDESLHRTIRFRLMRPPHAIQALCLDIASCLFAQCDRSVKIRVTDAVVDALAVAIDRHLAARYCAWIEQHFISLASTRSEPSQDWHHITPRLLSALSLILADRQDLATFHQAHRLLSACIACKGDLINDLLSVISRGSPNVRQNAISLLAVFYPQFTGENTVSAAPRNMLYGAEKESFRRCSNRHHYLLWRYEPEDQEECRVCRVPVEGAGLLCTVTKEVCHVDCMDTRVDAFHYEVVCLTETEDRQETVTIRYSRCLESAAELSVDPVSNATSSRCSIGDHQLHLVNLIDLALCWQCRLPIWGSATAAYVCLGGCQRLYHAECLESMDPNERCSPPGGYIIDEASSDRDTPFTISASALEASFDSEVGSIISGAESFDELSIAYGFLWTQYHRYKNGLDTRSVRVTESPRGAPPFRPMLKDLEQRMKASRRAPDALTRDGRSYLFDQDVLRQSGEVVQSVLWQGGRSILQSLQEQRHIRSETLARYFCQHLLDCGVIMGTNPDSPIYFVDPDELAGAVQNLLQDLDLTNNEIGLRLLTDRGWPTETKSPELLDSIGRAVLDWVMTTGEKLHQVVREYASQQRPPPGVRSTDSSVATYKAAQHTLLEKFVQPWLAALHHLDPASFTDMAYHVATESAKTDASVVIERITILADARVIFDSTMDLLVLWLEDVCENSAVDARILARFTRNDSQGKSALANLWIKISLLSAESPNNFANTCRWMRTLSATGLHIPFSTLSALSDLFPECIAAHVDLTVAIKTCLTPIDPRTVADLALRTCSKAVQSLPESTTLVQELWALLLDIYTRQALPKPKQGIRGSVELSPTLVAIGAHILSTTTELDELVMDAMMTLFSDRSRVRNVDAYIDENCSALYPLLWERLGTSKVPSELLYRLVSVRADPMLQILSSQLPSEGRLLCFLLDLKDCPTTRSPTIGLVSVLILALNKLGRHSRESLLPARLQIVSDHVEATLLVGSDEMRLEVLPKVMSLSAILPSWQVISLTCIDMLLADVSQTIERLSNASSAPSIAARLDATNLRLILVVHGLIAYTREKKPNWHLCQRFVIHVSMAAAAIGDSANSGALLTALTFTLDSSTQMSYSTDVGPSDQSVLVGAPYLPITLSLIKDIGKASSISIQRHLLSLAMVILSKHSFTGMELAALGALQSVAEYASFPSENRLLALQVLQVAYTTLKSDIISRVAPSLYLTLSRSSSGSSVVDDRARQFMRKMVEKSSSRFFIQTSVLGSERFAQALRGTRQLDKLLGFVPDVLKRDRNTVDHFTRLLQGMLTGDKVDAITMEIVESVGSLLSRLARHVAEWDANEFDPNPILCFVASILAQAPEDDRTTLVHQISTFLHLCIARFPVDRETIKQLLDASQSFRSVLEIPASATPVTLLALFEYYMDHVSSHAIPATAASACLHALRVASKDTGAETMVQLRLKAAQLLVSLERTSTGSLRSQLATIPSPFVYLHIFLPLLMALSNPPSDALNPLIPLLARVVSSSFQQVRQVLSEQDLEGHGADILSQIFAILQVASYSPDACALWTRIWPDWQDLLKASLDPKVVNGPLRALVQSNFADFVLYAIRTDSVIVARYKEPVQAALLDLLTSPARQSIRKLNKAATTSPALIGKPLDTESIRNGMITAEQMKMLRAM